MLSSMYVVVVVFSCDFFFQIIIGRVKNVVCSIIFLLNVKFLHISFVIWHYFAAAIKKKDFYMFLASMDII